MKKYLVLLLALLVALNSAAFAEEDTEKAKDLFDVWDYGDESMTWICTAIPVAEGAVMISAANLPEKQDQLAVTDGKNVWEVKAVIPDQDQRILIGDQSSAVFQECLFMILPYRSVKLSGSFQFRLKMEMQIPDSI